MQLSPLQKTGVLVGKTKKDKGTNIMPIVEAHGYPVALHIESASPEEATLVKNMVEAKIIEDLPPRLIGEKAYDSDSLDKKLAENTQVEMIAPDRRKRCKKQEGRQLRRYK